MGAILIKLFVTFSLKPPVPNTTCFPPQRFYSSKNFFTLDFFFHVPCPRKDSTDT